MITKANFNKLLATLSFIENEGVFSKKIHGILMQADIAAEKLVYPKGVKIEGEFTTNFSSAENFVVFECVHRLLELGYKPEQLTLEPKWKLGHGASGGRADVVIKDNDGKIFAIIECKTAGKEFNDAWDIGLQYPSQLFSYAQQEGSTQLLCLYTSDFIDGKTERQYYIITLKDNEELLQTIEDPEVLTYKKSQRFDEKFNVWKNTYLNEAYSIGFFEEDIQPFHFGRKNYSINDLKEISHADIQKKYHQFATILRKYNVSGRENAFDKLVNLFLCKVVDEQQNPINLGFYWKGRAYDNDFELQDRLQRLYQQGMKQFLNEDVTYINKEQIEEATIHKFFIQLKFFTNNEFAFIDVHNERLFQENAAVLRSIVEMLQDIKLKSDSENSSNQFLGDMFEGFLDSGVKQSEGQFFTPMPIVKFIMNSLPLEDVLINSEEPPKAIDYACGAGHFLTELARQIKPLVQQYKKADISEYYNNITGIEKEYRLSKVAKVSAFMYGQDDIQIIYADALAKNELIQNGTYNILVANPPYSVKGFLETLTHPDRRAFELFGSIEDKAVLTNNSIETFFIERAKQLLAPDGVAAIILPSSVLSNDAQQYRQTREILLKHFHLIAITELGSGTFGKTGTNTVTLFLRRRKLNPTEAEHYRYRAQCWIDGDVSPRTKKNKQYNDLHLLEAYCKHINIPFTDYKYFLTEGAPNETLMQKEIWKEYEKAFYESTEIKNHQKKPFFKRQSVESQKVDLNELLYRRIRHMENEKLYYFLLAQSNATPVLIIKSPVDNKAMKKFLGYEWSAAKGNEGIKYLNSQPVAAEDDEPVLITAQLNAIETPLYNAAQKDDASKLNYYINENFLGRSFTLPEELAESAHTAWLADMLDFSRKDFSKAISLSVKKAVEVISKWEIKTLGQLSDISRGASPRPISNYITENKNGVPWIKIGDVKMGEKYITHTEEKITQAGAELSRKVNKGDFVISNSMSVGRPFILKIDGCIHDGWLLLSSINKTIDHEYLYEILCSQQVQDQIKGIALGGVVQNLNTSRASSIKIPVPPIEVQQRVVSGCRKVDEAVIEASQNVEISKAEIEKKVEKVMKDSSEIKFESAATLEYGKPLKESDRIPGEFPVMGSNGIVGYHDHALIKGPSIIIGRKGSAGAVVFVNEDSYPIDTTFYVKYDDKSVDIKFFYYLLNTLNLPEIARGKGIGVPGLNRNNVHNLRIALPPLPIQQKLVKEIEILETQIATGQNVIQNAAARKKEVLRKLLE
jgi:type I restriction enzyme M protein